MKHILLATVAALTLTQAACNSPSHAASVCSDQSVLLKLTALYKQYNHVGEQVNNPAYLKVMRQMFPEAKDLSDEDLKKSLLDNSQSAWDNSSAAIMAMSTSGNATDCQLVVNDTGETVIYSVMLTDGNRYYVTLKDVVVSKDELLKSLKAAAAVAADPDEQARVAKEAAEAEAQRQKDNEAIRQRNIELNDEANERTRAYYAQHQNDAVPPVGTPIPQGETALSVLRGGNKPVPPAPVAPKRKASDPAGLY